MEALNDFVDFEDGERHGWENDIGSQDGKLKTESTPEGGNTFWSGKLQQKYPPAEFEFSASLAKLFTLAGPEQQDGMFEVAFNYRVHRLELGEAIRIDLRVAGDPSLGSTGPVIDENTPVGKWRQFGPTRIFYDRNITPVLIGTISVPENPSSRKIDIDNIRIVQHPLKK
ncbi:hypothetical protein YA0783_15490 [Pseudomonas corrugata]|uniref:hypothetical protein n=1 Tax=Pseudomonas corrugata TaxID=47879 RepID=UPI0018E6125C|nr:hypothetical protein [Pseudomonas corrugata]MBI6619718.1 hypothetical protein [Pseudomonas corrugata]MBI6690632.1 hypothetical protein [Pseudomonas corrugata]